VLIRNTTRRASPYPGAQRRRKEREERDRSVILAALARKINYLISESRRLARGARFIGEPAAAVPDALGGGHYGGSGREGRKEKYRALPMQRSRRDGESIADDRKESDALCFSLFRSLFPVPSVFGSRSRRRDNCTPHCATHGRQGGEIKAATVSWSSR